MAIYKVVIKDWLIDGESLELERLYSRTSMLYYYVFLRFAIPLLPHLLLFSFLSKFILEKPDIAYFKIAGIYFAVTIIVSLVFMNVSGSLFADEVTINIVVFSAIVSFLLGWLKPLKSFVLR